MQPTRVLIFGRGQLGLQYEAMFVKNGVETSLSQTDIRDFEAVWQEVLDFKPDLIINAAAKTNIDWCESNREEAFAVNTLGADNVARAAWQNNSYLVHISSGCVQESVSETDVKLETDTPNPLCFYAWTKVWAENLILDRATRAGLKVLVLRPRQLLSAALSKRNALIKMLTYNQFIDTPNSCTVVEDLLLVTYELIKKDVVGLINIVNPGITSPYKIALQLQATIKPEMTVTKISKQELNGLTRATRIDCVLDDRRLQDLGLQLAPLEKRLSEIIQQLQMSLNTAEGENVLRETTVETNSKLSK